MTGDLGPLERETVIMKQELRFPVEGLCPGNQPFVVLRGYPLCPPHQSGTVLMYSEETDWDRCDLPKIPGGQGRIHTRRVWKSACGAYAALQSSRPRLGCVAEPTPHLSVLFWGRRHCRVQFLEIPDFSS